MVFVGDGVIADLPMDNVTNQPDYERFKIGAHGDNFGDLMWRLMDGNDGHGEMPEKVAFLISHAGQREVELSGMTTADTILVAQGLGIEIGRFYQWLQARYPMSSTIFSGIIPGSSIGANNTSDLNGQIQTAIGTLDTTNRWLGTTDSSTAENMAAGTNIHLSSMTTEVVQAKPKSVIGLEYMYIRLADLGKLVEINS
jgi:hypothetical protein